MSTSDEQHASDETAADETTEPATGAERATTPAGAPSKGDEVWAAEARTGPAGDETPAPTAQPGSNLRPGAIPPTGTGAPSASTGMPTAPMRPVSTPAPADLDASARHAVLRPTPVPPEPVTPAPTRPLPGTPERAGGAAGAPVAGAAGLAAGAAAGAAAAGHATGTGAVGGGTPATAPATAHATSQATADDSVLFPDPNAPRTISVGTHVLGILVGIVLPVAAALVAALGISRILVVEVDGWVAKVDVLGIVLVTLGALLLLACVLLSLWTPYVGLVGGVILTVAGAFALYAPGVTRTGVLDVLTSEGWRPTVEETIVVATSGTVVVAGVLLLGAGIVSSIARRHGIRLGAFRERHRTA